MTAAGSPLRELHVLVLGEFALAVDGAPPFHPRGKAAEILALLGLDPGRALPTAQIAERIWSELPPERAAPRLHVQISRIRRMLEQLGCADVLHTRNDGYALDLVPEGCDFRRFETAVGAGIAAAARDDPRSAAQLLARALALWRGPVLGELGDREWARPEVTRLTDLHRQAADAWAQAQLALGDHDSVIARLERAVLDDPLRERTAVLLMTALYRAGRQADALNTYVHVRAALSDELGIDPSPALHATYIAVLRQDPALSTDLPDRATAPAAAGASGAFPVVDLPARTSTLIGRAAELKALEALDRPTEAGTTDRPEVVVLAGLGGVGKSRLALEAAHRAAATASIVWWVPAVDTVAAVDALGRLATALGVAEQADQSIVLARLWHELRLRTGWMLVYDDCPEPETFVALCPPAGSGRVLVTTRHRAWGPVGRVLHVDVLGLDDSVRMLTAVAGDDDEQAAAGLAAQLGGLPLALVQAGAYADQTGMSLAHYAGIFGHRRLGLLSRAVPDDHRLGVTATWTMSLDQIAGRSEAAAELLGLCASLGPGEVPLELLSDAATVLDGPLAAAVADELALEDTIAELLRFSLITRTRGGLVLHPLLRTVLQERTAAPAREEALARAGRILSALVPRHADCASDWPRWARWVPHALDVAARLEASGATEQAVELLHSAAGYLIERAIYAEAREAMERALHCARTTWGFRDPRLVPLQSRLGLVLERLGDLAAARRLQEQALTLSDDTGGRGSAQEVALLMRLGGVLACQRDLRPAVEIYERALVALEGLDTPHDEGRCVTDLALAQWMSGRAELALTLFDRAVATLERCVGERHPDTAHALAGKAVVLQDLGELEAAHDLLSRVITALIAAHGDRHPAVAHAYDKRAYTAGLLGRRRDSIDGHGRALAVLQDVYGSEHVELGMPLTNMGVVHLAEGDHEEAAAAQERAIALFRVGYGEHHPHTALATWRLGVVRDAQGRHTEAEQLLRRALDDTVAGLGTDHPDAAAIRSDLAAVRQQGASTP